MSILEVHDFEPTPSLLELKVVPDLAPAPTEFPTLEWLTYIYSPEEQKMVDQIATNRKWLDGYEAAGTFVKPFIDTRLRAVRNIVTSIGAYSEVRDMSAEKMRKRVAGLLTTQRNIYDEGPDSRSKSFGAIFKNRTHDFAWQTYYELAAKRDPLAICLAHLWKDGTMNTDEFDELLYNSVFALQINDVKSKMVEEVTRIRQANKLAHAITSAESN